MGTHAIDPELVHPYHVSHSKTSTLAAVRQLYAAHMPAVIEAEQALEEAHQGFIEIISPVTLELFLRAKGQSCAMDEEFKEALCLRSERLAKEMHQLREAYERQYGFACSLVNML